MLTRATLVAFMIFSIVGSAGELGASALLAQPQDAGTDLAAICPAQESDLPAVAQPRPGFLAPVPEGVEITFLAAHSAQVLPQGTEFALAVARVSLAEEVTTKRRVTAGPLLVMVEAGTIEVSVGGDVQRLGPGESLLAEMNQVYSIRTVGSEPAHVLLLGVLPPEGVLQIGAYGTPPFWIPIPDEAGIVSTRRLFYGEVGPLPREETLLFVTCLRWTDPAAEVASASYPGPVGVLVLQGASVVSGTDRIDAAGCSLYPASAPVHMTAGDQPPVIMFFGALRASALAQAPSGATMDDATEGVLPCAGPEDGGDG